EVNPIVHRIYFSLVNLIMPCYDIASIIAHGYNDIGMLHRKLFEVKYPASAVGTSSIEIQSMYMQGKRFPCLKFQLYSCQKSHPVVCINNIELLLRHDPQHVSSKKFYFLDH